MCVCVCARRCSPIRVSYIPIQSLGEYPHVEEPYSSPYGYWFSGTQNIIHSWLDTYIIYIYTYLIHVMSFIFQISPIKYAKYSLDIFHIHRETKSQYDWLSVYIYMSPLQHRFCCLNPACLKSLTPLFQRARFAPSLQAGARCHAWACIAGKVI